MKSENAPPRFHALRLFFGVALLNALLVFPVAYQSYKQYDTRVAAWDVERYMSITENGPAREIPPFRFRLLTSWAVAGMRVLPGYDAQVNFTGDAAAKRDFFHFVLLNGILAILTSALLFAWLRGKIQAGYAWAGSVLYLFSFYTVTCGFIPMVDSACHLAIMAGIMLFERRRPWSLALVCLIGVFAKETSLIVLIPWIAVHALEDRRNLRYLLAAAPALLAYVGAHWLFPAVLHYGYYKPSFMAGNSLAVLRPSAYGVTGLLHVVLAQLPLLVAGAAWAWLRFKGAARGRFLEVGLLMLPILWWMGMMMGLWNNTGRLIFMAFPAFILFEVRVMREVAARLGLGAEGEAGTSP